MKALIIDDEPLAHNVLLHHSRAHTDIEVVGQCFNATEALSFLDGKQVDLILLDIHMPVLSGLKMLRVMANRPQVILCTAYQEYALEGFEMDVTDYLLKPVSSERFAQALDKVRRRAGETASLAKPIIQNHIVIRVDREDRRVDLDKVLCFEAYGNYVKIWFDESSLLTAGTLKNFVATLPYGRFIQVHKSYLVNREKIVAQDSEKLRLINEKLVRIGKAFRKNLADLWK
ncbi:LytR/AlgR family response regulator transcription factor [Microbulbifer epialgicus]|uniref:LytR/AlgR family response regulator transcription factor n=1 Tax=Microbulbifer epialgicus TaxID=393907 RepID=A0ABV4P4C5_9GAMM